MALSPYKSELIRIANAEFDDFSEVNEADEPLRSRINQYCEGIGIEPPDDIGEFPWSAAFISWCVKTAGAETSEFKFSDTHAVFVKAAIANADGDKGVFRARPIADYSPKLGDLIHFNRQNGRITYAKARQQSSYPSHSAIVVDFAEDGGTRYAVTVGGNESDSVRRARVPLTSQGRVRQRDTNPYICVVETLKTNVAGQARAAARRGAGRVSARMSAAASADTETESAVCEASGNGERDASRSAALSGGKPPVDRTIPSPNKAGRNGQDIDHVVIHYTTTRNIESTIGHFKNRANEVSAHYIVGQDGELVQVVADSDCAWHSGNKPMNWRSIGIEHVAAQGDRITPQQAETSVALIGWLMQEYGVAFDNVIPHVCVKPTSCCGDLFKDYGGGADLSCSRQRSALHDWMRANGLGPNGASAGFTAADAEDELPIPRARARAVAGGRITTRARAAADAVAAATPRLAMAQAIIDFEARRDSRGRLKVYYLRPEDGGGRYEVAGINERYHRQICDELVELIENGRAEEAEERAGAYIAAYTDKVADWTGNNGIESYLRDSTFNRGMGGAAWMIQKAVGVETDRVVGPGTLTSIAAAEADPHALLDKLRWARERYEREIVGRGPGHVFWNGLVNRWNKAKAVALGFLDDR